MMGLARLGPFSRIPSARHWCKAATAAGTSDATAGRKKADAGTGKPPSDFRIDTLVTMGALKSDPHCAASVPIYQTATFDVRGGGKEFDYTRSGNPTRGVLESMCAVLHSGKRAFAFTSGMAALTACLRLLKPGDCVLASSDIYGGMHRELMYSAVHSGLVVEFVETWDAAAVERRMSRSAHRVKMICMESPTNPKLKVSDIRALARIARANDAYLLVDNSIMSPMLSRPLELGADLVVESATKYAQHAPFDPRP